MITLAYLGGAIVGAVLVAAKMHLAVSLVVLAICVGLVQLMSDGE